MSKKIKDSKLLGKAIMGIDPAIVGGDKSCYVAGRIRKGHIYITKLIHVKSKEANNENKKV